MLTDAPTPEELAPHNRELAKKIRNKEYQRSEIGGHVRTYLADCEWRGLSDDTLLAYEQVLAWFALDHADLELSVFNSPMANTYLTEFRDNRWGNMSSNTRGQRHAILKGFFKWCVSPAKLLGFNPMDGMKAPRRQTKEDRQAYDRKIIRQLIDDQDSLRDKCALAIYAFMGLRKNELRMLQIRDIDLSRDLIRIRYPKGGGDPHRMEIEFPEIRTLLEQHLIWEERQPDEYLLYPIGPWGRNTDPLTPLSKPGIHRWFKRCLERAELPDSIKLHELRHTAGQEIYAVTQNIVAAQVHLRHKSVATTEVYLHPTEEDHRAAIKELVAAWDAEETQ